MVSDIAQCMVPATATAHAPDNCNGVSLVHVLMSPAAATATWALQVEQQRVMATAVASSLNSFGAPTQDRLKFKCFHHARRDRISYHPQPATKLMYPLCYRLGHQLPNMNCQFLKRTSQPRTTAVLGIQLSLARSTWPPKT